jgi:hypothetical protein
MARGLPHFGTTRVRPSRIMSDFNPLAALIFETEEP